MMEDVVEEYIEKLFEDDCYLIVNKPCDLLINSDDENNLKTLHRMLMAKKDLKSENFVPSVKNLKHGYHFIHRLDYATSGVICLGKTSKAASAAGRLFEKRLVDKYYLAILTGHLSDPMVVVDIAIGYDSRHLEDNKMMVTDGPFSVKPRPAVTRILLLETGQYAGRDVSKVLMKPMTGRRHQLRVHCEHIGHTILGDFTYSHRSDTEPPRMFLHSHRLCLPLKTGPIDVSTSDPFSADNLSGLFKTGKVYNSLHNTNGRSSFDMLDGENESLKIS